MNLNPKHTIKNIVVMNVAELLQMKKLNKSIMKKKKDLLAKEEFAKTKDAMFL